MNGGETQDRSGVGAPRFLSFGDAAMLVEFGETVDRDLSEAVLSLDRAVTAAEIAGVIETAPSFRSLMIQFDPLTTDAAQVEAAVRGAMAAPATHGPTRPRRRWTAPTCYEAPYALDLEEVAERAGLSTTALIDLHASLDHHVYMIGFLPGSPYLGDLPEGLTFPRRREPRLKVPAGSVAIAIGLTVIYPVESPGGWHVLGRTPVKLFSPSIDPPALLAPGDAVRFEPVGAPEYDRIARAAAAGDWTPDGVLIDSAPSDAEAPS